MTTSKPYLLISWFHRDFLITIIPSCSCWTLKPKQQGCTACACAAATVPVACPEAMSGRIQKPLLEFAVPLTCASKVSGLVRLC